MRAPTVCVFGDGAFDAGTERADVGIGPYGVRSAGVHPTRRCGWADMQSAPTDTLPAFPWGQFGSAKFRSENCRKGRCVCGKYKV